MNLDLESDVVGRLVSNIRGESKFLFKRRNVTCYGAADILARLVGGDQSSKPRHIGFVYAASDKTFSNPAGDRSHTWSTVAAAVEANAGNIVMSKVSSNPEYEVSGDAALYEGNLVKLNAVADKGSSPVFSGGGYSASGPTAGSDKYFQAVLLSRTYVPTSPAPIYKPFAMIQLGDGDDGVPVESEFDLSLYWRIPFK